MNLGASFSSNALMLFMEAKDSTLYVWGSNESGALGTGDVTQDYIAQPTPLVLPPTPSGSSTQIQMVACGEYHTLLLTQDSRILVWGDNSRNQLGLPGEDRETIYLPTLLPLPSSKIPIHVACTAYSSAMVTEDGQAWTWGANNSGQGGGGDTRAAKTPRKVIGIPEPVIELAGGWEHHMALTSSGHVYAWGRNEDGKLGLGDTHKRYSAEKIPELQDISKIFCAGHSSYALTRDKKLYGWGWAAHGNLLTATGEDLLSPSFLLDSVENFSCGWSHMLAVLTDGSLVGWGFNDHGQLGIGNYQEFRAPRKVLLPEPKKAVSLITTAHRSFVVTSEGELWAFGNNDHGGLGLAGEVPENKISFPRRVEGIDCELPGRKERLWLEIFLWFFLGRMDNNAELNFPDEVLFNAVKVLL
jgi:alpha-tubulin suppressor-like RCC1 family protein